jgi:DNA polymerase III gamma/tau subunit
MSDAFITKYRPETFEQVAGHVEQVKALKGAITKKRARTFLFTGPSGTGKTTLARIAASTVGCQPHDILEIDAATHTGIDDMREVTSAIDYRPVGDSKLKAVIVDEVHALSKAATQSLLKALEDPPAWGYWFLCTTEAARVLPTLRTRCFRVDLKPLSDGVLIKLLDRVAVKEKLICNDNVINVCVDAADGSARQALTNLALCAEVRTGKKAAELLRSATDNADAAMLARALMFGNWKQAQDVLNKLGALNPESVRYVVRAYVSKVVRSAKKEGVAGRGIEVLDAFSEPFYDNAALDLAVGKVLLA